MNKRSVDKLISQMVKRTKKGITYRTFHDYLFTRSELNNPYPPESFMMLLYSRYAIIDADDWVILWLKYAEKIK